MPRTSTAAPVGLFKRNATLIRRKGFTLRHRVLRIYKEISSISRTPQADLSESPPSDVKRPVCTCSTDLPREQGELASEFITALEEELFRELEVPSSPDDSESMENSTNPPIQRLPIELLQVIFGTQEFYTAPGYYTSHGTTKGISWVVSQVCRKWRDIALATSGLWRDLPRVHLSHPSTMHPRYLEFFTEYLLRSNGGPIHVDVDNCCVPNLTLVYDTHPIVDLLVEHSERWRKFEVHTDGRNALTAFSGARGRLSSLEVLSLTVRSESREVIDVFAGAPRLRRVNVYGTHPGLKLSLPYRHLTHFSRSFSNRDDLRDGGFQFALTHLTVNTFFPAADVVVSGIMSLPQLESLSLDSENGSLLTSFLRILWVPALNTLHVRAPIEGLLPAISAMISRSDVASVLKTLCLNTKSLKPGDLSDLLELTPAVERIDVPFPPSQDLNALTGIGYAKQLAPCLKHCFLYSSSIIFGQTMEDFKLLASSRCELQGNEHTDVNTPHPLETLSLQFVHRNVAQLQQDARVQQNKFEDRLARTQVAADLLRWRDDLVVVFPELGCNHPVMRPDAERYPPWAEEAFEYLWNIEDCEVADASDIYRSGIHFSLDQARNWRTHEDEDIREFAEHAQRILVKWTPLFLESVSGMRWRLYVDGTLTYIPRHEGLRNLSNIVDLVCGNLEPRVKPYVGLWGI